MTAPFLAKQFEMNHWAIHATLDGITHEESLKPPPQGGNCLNWIVGHVVATRSDLLRRRLGLPAMWTQEEAAPYAKGAQRLDKGAARALGEIVRDFDRSQAALVHRLLQLSDADLAAPTPRGTMGDELAIYSFHESYHVGQCGLLRRILGYERAVG